MIVSLPPVVPSSLCPPTLCANPQPPALGCATVALRCPAALEHAFICGQQWSRHCSSRRSSFSATVLGDPRPRTAVSLYSLFLTQLLNRVVSVWRVPRRRPRSSLCLRGSTVVHHTVESHAHGQNRVIVSCSQRAEHLGETYKFPVTYLSMSRPSRLGSIPQQLYSSTSLIWYVGRRPPERQTR